MGSRSESGAYDPTRGGSCSDYDSAGARRACRSDRQYGAGGRTVSSPPAADPAAPAPAGRTVQNPRAADAAAPAAPAAGRTAQSQGAADGGEFAIPSLDSAEGQRQLASGLGSGRARQRQSGRLVDTGQLGSAEGGIQGGMIGPGVKQHGTNIPSDVVETASPGMIADPENPLWQIKFKHIATGQTVSFPGWVTQFSDQFQSQWNEEMAYGRMDPMSTFQHTRRNISVSLDIPAANKPQAINNTAKLDKLSRFLYPVYHEFEPARSYQNTLKAAPLLEVSWANFIQDQGVKKGLVGYIRGINYEPDFDAGFFLDGAEMYPQLLRINFDLTVLHTHLTGWTGQESSAPIMAQRQRSVVAPDGMSAKQEDYEVQIGTEKRFTVSFGDGSGGVHTTSQVRGGTASPAESAVNVSQMEVDNRNAQEERHRERELLRAQRQAQGAGPRTGNRAHLAAQRRRNRAGARSGVDLFSWKS